MSQVLGLGLWLLPKDQTLLRAVMPVGGPGQGEFHYQGQEHRSGLRLPGLKSLISHFLDL